MARRARMRPIRTIALTVRPASARAAAITINSFCSEAVGFAGAASAAAGVQPDLTAGCCTSSARGSWAAGGVAAASWISAGSTEARVGLASFHRIDDSGAGVSTFGMAARGLF